MFRHRLRRSSMVSQVFSDILARTGPKEEIMVLQA